MSKTLCFDLDDTIIDANNEPLFGVKEAMQRFKDKGCKIIISSARFDTKTWGDLVAGRIKKVRELLDQHKIPYDDVVSFKPPADIYIDDKGYHFTGNWMVSEEEISKRLHL